MTVSTCKTDPAQSRSCRCRQSSRAWRLVTPNPGGHPARKATLRVSPRRDPQPLREPCRAAPARPPHSSVELTDRQYDEFPSSHVNSHVDWYKARNHLHGSWLGPLRLMFTYVVFALARHSPSMAAKRWLFRRFGMKLGRNVTIASGAMLDYFFPELIEIGDDTVVGMDALVLTHEYLRGCVRRGKVRIGAGCVIGAQATILAGVSIGDGATIAAKSLVHKCVPEGAFVGGSPARILRPASN